MITVTNASPLPFEQIVVEELAQEFAKHSLRLTSSFPKFFGQRLEFQRRREGQVEEVCFQRAFYDDEQLRATDLDDEVETTPIYFGEELFWVSRHSLSVQFIVDGATNWLQRNGRAGTGDDYWWHFTDEADLRRLLRELLPMILTAGEATFDARLEDYREGYVKRPAVA